MKRLPAICPSAYLASLLILQGLMLPAGAHNGQVTLAHPVEHIRVDGDLSDWPEEGKWHAIEMIEWGDLPLNERDFNGRFKVGYHTGENALYAAVEIEDESAVVDTTASASWDTQDGCELYVDLKHGDGQYLVAKYDVYGEMRRGEHMQVAVVRGEKVRRYEWRIALDKIRAGTEAGPGRVLGFDIAVPDKDADGSFSWMAWGRGRSKFEFAERRGDVLLLEREVPLGRIEGQVVNEQGTIKQGASVHIRLVDEPSQYFGLLTDTQGRYALSLPVGHYQVEWGVQYRQRKAVEVKAGETERVDMAIERPVARGRTLEVGSGTRVRVGAGRRQGAWRSIGVSDGLPHPRVEAIIQSWKGELWLGTRAGLCRYNGRQFECFSRKDGLPDERIQALCEDRSGHLWIGTGINTLRSEGAPVEGKGVYRFDGRHFTLFDKGDGLAGNNVYCIHEDREGALWFGVNGGLSRFDGRYFTTFNAEDGLVGKMVRSLTEGPKGDLWIGTDQGVSRYDGENFEHLTGGKPLFFGLGGVISMLYWQNALWLGTEMGGLLRYENGAFTRIASSVFAAGAIVHALAEDSEGDLWIGTNDGLIHYDGKHWTKVMPQDVRRADSVYALEVDSEGVLWVGTTKLRRYDRPYVETFTTEDGLSTGYAFDIQEDRKGNKWIATTGGLSRYDGSSFTLFTTEEGLPNDRVTCMLVDREDMLWVGTWGGLSRYDGTSFTPLELPHVLPGHWPVSLAEDRAGNLWIGTRFGGVLRYDGKHFKHFNTEHGLVQNYVRKIIEDQDGNLWFGTNRGICRFDGSGFVAVTASDTTRYDLKALLMTDRRGGLWFGIHPGAVSRYDGKQFERYSAADGLVGNDHVTCMLEDRRGHLWFGTWGGIFRSDGTAVQSLQKRDGLVGDTILDLFEDRAGDIWITTYVGMMRYRPYHAPPKVALTDVITDRRHGAVVEIALSASQDFLAFEFEGYSMKTRPEAMVYVYRLEGHDEAWKTTGADRVEYHDLPRGRYTFEVKAVDRDLSYSEEPAVVQVEVHWPYERIGWGAALGLAGVLVVWQTRRIVQRDRRLRAANATLRQEMAERERLDEQLQQLRYLYRLRGALAQTRAPEEAVQQTGQILMDVLQVSSAAGAHIVLDGRDWRFGETGQQGQIHYQRPLVWSGKERGQLHVCYGVALSRAQEGALLDETAGQLARTLEAQELTLQLMQSARLVSLGQMAAGVAHELNQPLSAISMAAGNLHMHVQAGRALNPQRLEERMRDILSFVERMAGTIEHLRLFSRDTTEEPTRWCRIDEAVESSLKVLGAQLKSHGIAVQVRSAGELPAVRSRPYQLEQVVLNLLANARDAVDERQAAESGCDKRIWVETWREGNWVCVEVRDNGVGIEAAHVERLYEPFFTTKEADRGTGLGLSISYAIVREHGGELRCQSRRGEGTVFAVKLPVAEEEA